MALFSMCRNILTKTVKGPCSKSISTTAPVFIKEIKVETNGKVKEIFGEFKKSPREGQLLHQVNQTGKHSCVQCALGLHVKHTDVLILHQYLRSNGTMLPRRITGLCKVQQRYIGDLVRMAHKAGLMMNFNPKNSCRDPSTRRFHKKFNTYFDEKTIKYNRKQILVE